VVAESGNILGRPLPAEAFIVILFGQLPRPFYYFGNIFSSII